MERSTLSTDGDTTFRLLAAELRSHQGRLAAEYTSRLQEELPEWSIERPELADTIRAGAEAAIGGELQALAEEALPDACPEFDAEGARQCARLGVPLEAVLLQYRLGHAVQWEAWFEIVEAHELSAAKRRELLARGSRFFFEYANRLTRLVVAEYESERGSLLRRSEQRRSFLVRELLAGRSVDVDAIGYDLSYHHLGAVAWGDAPDEALRRLAARLDRTVLVIDAGEGVRWSWLGGVKPLGPVRRLGVDDLAAEEGTRLALGDDEPGVEGFRRTHRQALVARHAAERLAADPIRYDDIALEALACADRDAARAFVTRELRGLDAADARSERLRRTLDSYFRCGQNAAAAAADLGVHQQTVGQRLRAMEDVIGARVSDRRAELEVALRLRSYLGDQ
jgi:DNA-binding PucR family transcriptional regulator